MSWWWPWSRRRRRRPDPKLAQAEASHRRAVKHRERAEQELQEVKELRLGDWARQTTAEDRFDLRLEAAWRTRLSRGNDNRGDRRP